ncbi:MAG: polysaccharide pyruvyl transferase family protein [Chitinophagaceae bacterium]|nr:polysaccharide pyruvyl transferase family protein [Chitinophagaceae bacterium]
MAPSYGLLTYPAWPEYNAGDYIQSLAAAQFLPRVDRYVSREKLNEYRGDKLKLIMNGWFMHRPDQWPPSPDIDPLMISFHLNSQAKDQMLNAKGVEWLKRYAPVGCRDPYTLENLSNAGIESFQSGCLTTTFENNYVDRTSDIYFVDVLFRVPGWSTSARTPREFLKAIFSGDITRMSTRGKLLKQLFSEELLTNAKHISHYHPARHSEKERFEVANNFLRKYATAKLVVTSRLHCALPCLAFGTPVIFVHYGFENEYDICRLNGVTDLFNTIYIDDKGNVSSNLPLKGAIGENIAITNPDSFRADARRMREMCSNFINDISLRV